MSGLDVVTEARAAAAALRHGLAKSAKAQELSADMIDRLCDLLGRATGFVFEPDLGTLAHLTHYWRVRVIVYDEDVAVIKWADSPRLWSRDRDDWLSLEESEWLGVPGTPQRDDVVFRRGEAFALVPKILAVQTDRAHNGTPGGRR